MPAFLPLLCAICSVYGASHGCAGIRLALGQRGAPSSQAAPQTGARASVMCGVSAVRGPVSDPCGPYIHTQSIRLKLRCDQKVRTLRFFFCYQGAGKGEPMLTMGLCDRSPARGVRSAGARRSAQMVILGVRVVVNSGLSNNYTGALATGRTNNRCVGSSLSLASLACHFLTYTFAAKDSSWRIPNNCTRRSSG